MKPFTIDGNNPITNGPHKLEISDYKAVIKNIGNTNITGEIETKYSVKWFDNNTIYFTMDDSADGSDTIANYKLYKINRDGSNFSNITTNFYDTSSNPVSGVTFTEIDVSEQGYIAGIGSNGKVYTNRNDPSKFIEVDLVGSGGHAIQTSDGLSWSSDGKKITYKEDGINAICVFNIAEDSEDFYSGVIGSLVNTPNWSCKSNISLNNPLSTGNIYFRSGNNIGSINVTITYPAGVETYNYAIGGNIPNATSIDRWPSVENGNFMSNNTTTGNINAATPYTGWNSELTPDGATIASISATNGIGTVKLSNFDGSGLSILKEDSIKNQIFNSTPYLNSNSKVGTNTYTFTYKESNNSWEISKDGGLTVFDTINSGNLNGYYNVGYNVSASDDTSIGLIVNLKNSPRLSDGDKFTIETEAITQITLDANGDYSLYTIQDPKDGITTVTNSDGGYIDIEFDTGGPVAGSYNFTVSGTPSTQYDSIEIMTTNDLSSKLDLEIPSTFTSAKLNIENVSVLNSYYAEESQKRVDEALNMVITERAKIGAKINCLEIASNSALTGLYGDTKALSGIIDTDYAAESVLRAITGNMQKANIDLLYNSNIGSNVVEMMMTNSDSFRDFVLI